MEIKKPLVIIPPYSEPLQKLEGILNSPEEAEQTEVYVVDDLKEAGQLIPTLGQCLIVIANAKKCALFLQENRWAISKNHSKVILMTPKEIPQKTLMKFLKIGLTEVILETLPPKSLLYKIKLLLRSVKGQKNEKDETIAVKSMIDLNQNKSNNEEQRIEKGVILGPENTNANELEKDKDSKETNAGDTFDYLKGKKKENREENVIDTHWKSMKKTNELSIDIEPEEAKKTENDNNEISTYYKTDRNKNIELDILASDNMKGNTTLSEEYSSHDIHKLKKHDDVEINFEKEKKKKAENQEKTYEEEKMSIRDVKETVIDLEKEKSPIESESSSLEKAKREKNQQETSLNLEDGKKKEQEDDNENVIDNFYRGKITKEETTFQLDEENYQDESKPQSIENENLTGKLSKTTELDFENEKKRKEESSKDNDDEKEENNRKNTDLNLEQPSHMSGKLQQNSMQIEEEELREKKSNETELNLTKNQRDIQLQKQEEAEENDLGAQKSIAISDDIDNADKQNEDDLFEYEEQKQKERKKDFDIEFEKDSSNNSEDKQDSRENNGINKLQRLLSDSNDNSVEKESNDLNSELESDLDLKKLKTTEIEFDNSLNGKNSGNGKIEHIDKFMRSKDSKGQDHDWNINQKKKDSTIELEKKKSSEINLDVLNKFKDQGEITIDYKKLKEEFEILKEGENLSSGELEKLRKSIRGEDNDDDSNHQVFTPSPNGCDFLMEIAFELMDHSIKTKDLFEKIAFKILDQNGYCLFFQYNKPSDIKEIYSIFNNNTPKIKESTREKFQELKNDSDYFKSQTSYSLSKWRSPEHKDKNGMPWEENELPNWADSQFKDKIIEFIYPMYDGLDRMGHIYVWYPDGIKYSEAKNLEIILEASRAIYLDQVIRSTNKTNKDEEVENSPEKQNGFLSGISSLFNRKKAG